MKPKIILLLILSLMIGYMSLNAQQGTGSIKLWTLYSGYVITHDDDTIYGHIKLNNLVSNQTKALFFEGPYDEKFSKKYKPREIKAYKVGPRFYESFKFRPVGASGGRHFFLLKIGGPISLYEWYYEPTGLWSERTKVNDDNIWASEVDFTFSENDLTEETIIIKLDNDPQSLTEIDFITNFEMNMSKIVEDYEDLAAKIKNNEMGYRIEDLEKIIREYNRWYLMKDTFIKVK